jgi:hypothetical protein
MSNALAIAAVTAILEQLLNAVLNDPQTTVGGTVTISALAPDILQTKLGGETALNVNLFLHQVSHNAAWRNTGFPSLAADGSTALRRPPLALDLHYLLTAYASEDTQAEALLGYALLMLHENAVIPRNQIRSALTNPQTTNLGANPLSSVLATSGLADQVEMIKIIPSPIKGEEMAWLWTALKADYRPTYPFLVSVVLIDSQYSPSVALPVLSRNVAAQAGPPPQLVDVQPPTHQIAAAPGDTVTLAGQSLSSAILIKLTNPQLGVEVPLFAPLTINDRAVTFAAPDQPASIPAGIYNAAVLIADPSGQTGSTNSLLFPLAPTILGAPPPAAATNNAANPPTTTVTLSCKPQVLPQQSVTLILGSHMAAATGFATATSALTFVFPALPPGSYLARLRVDGVESPINVNWNATPPSFQGPFITV